MPSASRERVILNISGDIFETYRETLKRFPESLLGNPKKRKDYYDPTEKQYFFNRCRVCFGAILYFYQSNGMLRCPPEVPIDIFETECAFYKIPNDIVYRMKLEEGFLPDMENKKAPQQNLSLKIKIWNFLEKPGSSNAAKWYAIIAFVLIWLSVLTACLETLPHLRSEKGFLHDHWGIIELTLNCWFLIEICLRFAFSPNKTKFVYDFLNWIDAIVVFPYFFTPLFTKYQLTSISFLRILKMVRLMRLFRLSKHSKRLKVIAAILKASMPDLQLLIVCLGIILIFGGSIMYYLEKSTPEFVSIPESMWWAIQTITTVGYGDIIPKTIAGRLLSAALMTFGAITIALPVIAIVSKFLRFYAKNIDCNTH